jgi:hypothetical protein
VNFSRTVWVLAELRQLAAAGRARTREVPDLERLVAGVAANGHRPTAVIARFRW